MSDDPDKGHYHAHHDPSSPVKGAGTDEMAGDLQRMYYAGRVTLPKVAATMSRASQALAEVQATLVEVSGRMEDPDAMRDLRQVRADLQRVAYRTTLVVQDGAEALVNVVYLFASSDADTADAFNALSDDPDFEKAYRNHLPPVPPPTAPSGPVPEPTVPGQRSYKPGEQL